MRVITPLELTDSELISSTIAEPTASIDPSLWVSGHGYAIGDSVYLVSTHKIYTALTTINAGSAASTISPETDIQLAVPKWTEVGSTNRWNMFDVYRNTSSIVDSTSCTIVLGTPTEEETDDFDPYHDDVVLLLQTFPQSLSGYTIKDQSLSNKVPVNVYNASLTVDATTMATPSLYFAAGYFQYADSEDWYFPADFTVELSIMFNAAACTGTNRVGIIAQASGIGYASWAINTSMGRRFVVGVKKADTTNVFATGTITLIQPNVEYFLALVRKGNTLILSVNGQVEITLTVDQPLINIPNQLGIGILGEYNYSHGGEYGTMMMGWIRVVRITKNVARYDGNFTVPTLPFANSSIKLAPSNISSANMSILDLYDSSVEFKLESISAIPPSDLSINNATPTFTETTGLALDTASMSVDSLNFTGGYLQYNHTNMYPGSDNFSWEFYVRFNAASVGDRLIIAGQAGPGGGDNIWFIGKYNNETLFAMFKNSSGTIYMDNSYLKVLPNVDYYIVYERYGDTITIYVNNTIYIQFLVSGAMAVSSTKLGIGVNGEYIAGGYGGSGGSRMMGNIGFVRFTKQARYTRALGGFLDSSKSLALLDLDNVGSVRVLCDYYNGSGYTTISDNLYYLNTRNVYDWWTYFTTQFIPKKSLVLEDLPTGYSGMRVTITFTGSNPMSIGSCIIGDSTFIGRLAHGAELDALNFSTMERDIFGNATLVPRKEVSTLSAKLHVDKTIFENVQAIKADLDARPAVWVGIENSDDPYYHALIFLGIYREFNFQLDNPIGPSATLELEEM